MSRLHKPDRAAVSAADQALRELRAQVPQIDCKGHCHTSCGPIFMGLDEHRQIAELHGGPIPHAARNLRGQVLLAAPDLVCPLLDADRRCTVYRRRPLICMLWGVVESMPCIYGCRPERWLTDEECISLLLQSGAWDGLPMTASSARSLLGGLRQAHRDELGRRVRGQRRLGDDGSVIRPA